MEYWCLVLKNYEDYDDMYYFENYEIAKQNFDNICEKHKDYDEFSLEDEHHCEWFDADYNEYSTYISLEQFGLPTIFNEILF